ncbi:MAG TPA: type II secretion system protein GspG [Candidatus Saccharimonadales bacterium]|nr:type II secretion system protein GspG [Candidatus Saccharimonadales bacterium]
MKRVIIIVSVLIAVSFVLPAFFPGTVPRGKITRQRMAFDRVRILEYGRVHGQLPPNLAALPRLGLKPEADHYLEDAWHKRLIYEVESSGTVTLKSLGKDGALGGSDDDADIIFRFPSHNADGSWIEANYSTYDSYEPPQQ